MMTIILILSVGILLVNMYFFKAVCKSNDAINTTIDKIKKQIEYINANIKTSTNIQRDTDDKVNNINSKMINVITNISESKIEILDTIVNNITVKIDNLYKLTETVNTGSNLTAIQRDFESVNSSLDLVSAKLSKLIENISRSNSDNLKWQQNVAKDLTEIYGEAVETRKAIISSKSKPQVKPKKALPKENKSAK